MAIKLIANYSKRLGLPGYSSHQFEVSIETEISNPSEVQAVSANIYNMLQSAVDEQIQQVGFVPDEQYGKQGQAPAPSGYHQDNAYNKRSQQPDSPAPQEERWQCTEKQQSALHSLFARLEGDDCVGVLVMHSEAHLSIPRIGLRESQATHTFTRGKPSSLQSGKLRS